ncbi:MAG TPA: flagellar export chaperone FlgN [Acidimicrobiales bacterium]|nr:flagellar export chaperone FlgN [Acidimicrobiales bacterium]
MELEELSNILWQERQLLELLLFKLETEQLLLAAGNTRWLGNATHEVEVVLEELRSFEVLRATGVQEIGQRLGYGDEPPRLGQLSESAPAPWDGIFREHRAAFLSITNEINAAAAANRELLARAQRATESTLAWLVDAEQPDVYSGRGAARSGGRTRHLFDEVM